MYNPNRLLPRTGTLEGQRYHERLLGCYHTIPQEKKNCYHLGGPAESLISPMVEIAVCVDL
ncbi:hypothetical protein DPMN_104282 [Dreissena polymorpha]|uniref:Uncharacterized protein n=1 Tax=Dreissena polymorpha TaxID=45954 RepID=A0A9D4H9H2_DREPO|nr:hypothetical protein DPMN_104282 [Dreissena polymorpha]